MCSTLVNQLGSMERDTLCLRGWFGGQGSDGKAYDFFVCKADKWPCKPIIWKSCVIPKHRFCLWLLAHGKLLTKD